MVDPHTPPLPTLGIDTLLDQLATERQRVDVGEVSFSTREIVRMFEEGELTIAPAYQRKFRWPQKVASKFIESMFLGLPIPPIFVAADSDFEWEVVDGLQRISTLILFLSSSSDSRGVVSEDGMPLKLSHLEKLDALNGHRFEDLPDALRRYFNRQPLQFILLTDKSDPDVRFELFERLNSGSIQLTPQEVRRAVYRGEFSDFIEDLSTYEPFTSMLKLQEGKQKNGTQAEQVLKFFAYKNSRGEFKGQVKSFLNSYVKTTAKSFNFEKEGNIFRESCDRLSDLLPGKFFLKSDHSTTPLTEFEACLVAIGELVEAGEAITTPPDGWLDDPVLVRSSTGGTNTKSMLEARINRARYLFSAHR